MGVEAVYVLHGINLAGSTFISELTDLTPESNTEEIVGYAAGWPDPLFLAAGGHKPDITFSTPQLATLLAALGSSYCLDLSGGNTDLYYRKPTDLGVRVSAGSSAHVRLRVAQGLAYWTRLTMTHQQPARVGVRIVPTWDGTNLPLVPAGSQALAGTPAATEHFTLGPVKVNGSELPSVDEVSLDLGVETIEVGSGGEQYITFAAIGQRRPVLEISTYKLDAWSSYGLDGLALSSSGVVVYARKKSPDGGTYADNATSHVSLTGAKGVVRAMRIGGQGNSPTRMTLRIPLRAASASADVLAIDTATAIS